MTTSHDCTCGWKLHFDEALDEVSLDLDQVRDLLNACGFDAGNLLSVQVSPDRVLVRRWRTTDDGKGPTVTESVVSHR